MELSFSTPHSIKVLTNTTLITHSSSGSKLDYPMAMTCYLCESFGCTDLRFAVWAYQSVAQPHRFLDGESLGNTTLNASFALEDFFVPPELDLRFNHLGMFPDP